MHLRAPLRSLSSDNHGRVLTVLADADRPLAGNAIATRADMSRNAALRVLDDLVATGIVWRARLHNRWSLHILDPEHLLVPALLDLADVGPRLQARLAAHVEDWSPPPATVSARAPASDRADEPGRDMVELLVAVDDPALLDDPVWIEQVNTLVQALSRWTGNQVHLIHTAASMLKQQGTGERAADTDDHAIVHDARWLLAAGRALVPPVTHQPSPAGRADHPHGQKPSWLPGWPNGPQA